MPDSVTPLAAPPANSLLPQQFFWDYQSTPGKIWVGVPASVDPSGRVLALDTASISGGPGGFLPTSGGAMTGPLVYTATGGTVSRSAQDRSADVANVLDFGADPAGVLDSAPAFAAALATRRNGRAVDVFVPSGLYLLNSPITVGHSTFSQRLFGNGWSTVLNVGPGFSSAALGVILINGGNAPTAQASVCDLRINFLQPPDFTTTATATTAVAGTTLTLANVSGIKVGYYCYGGAYLPTQSIMAKVVSIVGNVVTLDRGALLSIPVGASLSFAAPRDQMVALSAFPTLNPGDPGIKYPWAIYANSQSVFLDHILVSAGWNGIYIRGQTFVIGQYFNSCLNIGMDLDQCYNFPKISHYQIWSGFGLTNALMGVYYDGLTIAANIGECDDFTCDIFQSWCCTLNITAAWSWGEINQLKLDGDNANLNVAVGAHGWLHIGDFYSTDGNNSIGVPCVFNGTTEVVIGTLHLVGGQNNPSIILTNGTLVIEGGYMWDGQFGTWPMISVTGGGLSIDQMRFDTSAGRTRDYITQTGGWVRVNNSIFGPTAGSGGLAFNLTDNALNSINNITYNGWTFVPPGPLGIYQLPSGQFSGRPFTAVSIVDMPSSTVGQLRLAPPNTALSLESKTRFFGTFGSGADFIARYVASLRSGMTGGWNTGYVDIWLSNVVNDVASDANQIRVARFTSAALQLGVVGQAGHIDFARASDGNLTGWSGYSTANPNTIGLVNLTGSGAILLGAAAGGAVTLQVSATDRMTVTDTAITALLPLVLGASGPTVRSGTGAATGTQPKGSLWTRTDGAVGSTLYVSQGAGTWNAVAGV